MSEELKKVLTSSLKDLLDVTSGKKMSPNEVEISFRNVIPAEAKDRPWTSAIFFHSAINNVRKMFGNPSVEYQLVIHLAHSISGERAVLNGKDSIQQFCKTGLNIGGFEIEQKKSVKSSDKNIKSQACQTLENEYPLRLRVSEEKRVKAPAWVFDKTSAKVYRYRQRFSFQASKDCRFDFSVYREGKGTSFATATGDDKTPLLKMRENYDIEIDFSFKNHTAENVADELMRVGTPLLKLFYKSPYFMKNSEMKSVRDAYLELTGLKMDKRFPFVGAAVVPGTLKNLLDVEKYPMFKPFHCNLDEYVIAHKADGERYLLFFDKSGDGYLIDSLGSVIKTDYKMESIESSLFDCEAIFDTDGVRVLVFDTIFFNGVSQRELPLVSSSENQSRSLVFGLLCGSILSEFLKESGVSSPHFRLQTKRYYFMRELNPGEASDVVGTLSTFLEEHKSRSMGYNTDGFILTHSTAPYPTRNNQTFALKVKDMHQVTVDFGVKRDRENGVLTLYVKDRAEIVPFKPKHHNQALPNFNKGVPEELEDGFPMYDDFVYEFTYDAELMVWKPIRHRPVKTYKNTPNAYETANTNWDIILNMHTSPEYELSESNLVKWLTDYHRSESRETFGAYIEKTRQLPEKYFDSLVETKYDQVKERLPILEPLRKAHNLIKSQLYQVRGTGCPKRQQESLIEFAGGQANDLFKWVESPTINRVLSLEIDADQFESSKKRVASAGSFEFEDSYSGFNQYLFKNEKYGEKKMLIQLLQADMTRDLISGLAGMKSEDQRKLYDLFHLSEAVRNFDVGSCQFALHYAMKNEETVDAFLDNIANTLRKGATFISTFMDGKRVFKQLNSEKNKTLEYRDADSGRLIWRLKALYGDSEWRSLGLTVDHYMTSLNLNEVGIQEYLVDVDYLVGKAGERGLKLEKIIPFESIYNGDYKGEKLYGAKWNEALNGLKRDKMMYMYSKFNVAVVFSKECDPEERVEEVANVEEFSEGETHTGKKYDFFKGEMLTYVGPTKMKISKIGAKKPREMGGKTGTKLDYFFPDIPVAIRSKIKYDDVSLYSITDQRTALSQAFLLSIFTEEKGIVDATACVGGNVFGFNNVFNDIVAVEIDKNRCSMLQDNINLLQINNRVTTICEDFVKLYYNDDHRIRKPVVFFDPPWGGVDYKSKDKVKLALGDKDFQEFITDVVKGGRYKVVSMKLPLNADIQKIESAGYQMVKIQFNKMLFVIIDLESTLEEFKKKVELAKKPGSHSISQFTVL